MKYKDFKKKLLDLDLTIIEFSSIFGLNRTTVHKNKDNVSKTIRNYVLLLEALGVEKTKELLENK